MVLGVLIVIRICVRGGVWVFDVSFALWTWMGSLHLGILGFQDLRNNMLVDDRRNWLMMGATVMILSHVHRSIWYILLLIVILLVAGFFVRRFRVFGEADLMGFAWIYFGFGYVNPFVLFWFVIFCFGLTGLVLGVRDFVLKRRGVAVPYFPVIFFSFFLTGIVFRLY